MVQESMVLQVVKTGDQFSVEVIDEYAPKDGLACEQQTPVEFDGSPVWESCPKMPGP